MKSKEAPFTADFLNACLEADFETGVLRWKVRPREHFLSDANHHRWNKLFSKKPALKVISPRGYAYGKIRGRDLSAHRAIYFLATGVWPEEVDHINGDKADNRLCNLRAVTRQQNAKNLPTMSDNTTGVSGVSARPNGRFMAQIGHAGKLHYIGTFDTLSEAAAARKAAEARLGFHENHGRAVA